MGYRFVFVAVCMLLFVNRAPAESGQGSLTGVVVDAASGQPLVAAHVYLKGTELWAYSDLAGQFSIENVPAGTYVAVAALSGYQDSEIEDLTIPSGEPVSMGFRLTPDAGVSGPTGVLSGTVVHPETGEPLSNVTIILEGTDFKTTTDNSGHYTLLGLPAGEYSLIATRPWFDAVSLTGVWVEAGQVNRQDFALPQRRRGFWARPKEEPDSLVGTVSGRIVDIKSVEPVVAAGVYLENTDHWAHSGLDGRFALDSVPAGLYTLTVTTSGYGEISLEGIEVTPDSVIDLPIFLGDEGGTRSAAQAGKVMFGTLTGTVRDSANGELLPQVALFLEGTPFRATTDSMGVYAFDSLSQASYTLVCTQKGYNAIALTDIGVVPGETRTVDLLLTPYQRGGQDAADWFSRPGTITGKVTDVFSDQAAEGVVMFIKGTVLRDTTDGEGYYSLEQVPPTSGTYTLCGYKAGQDTLCMREITVLPEDLLVQNFQVDLSAGLSDEEINENRAIVSGQITDSESKAPLVGATIMLEGTRYQATTDFQGRFKIVNVRPGTYTLVTTKESYLTTASSDIQLKQNELFTHNVALEKTDVEEMQRMVVKGQAVKNTDAALLKERKEAVSFRDAISSEEISRAGAGNAADAMKQVTGATVIGGKYVFVRGLGDRYTLVQLNGAELPSPDPDKKTVPMDLFPSDLLDNIITQKTFTPDQPGSFTGGCVNIQTKSYPDKPTLTLSLSGSYNTQSTFRKGFLTYSGGETDWLGIDDGYRAMPEKVRKDDLIIPVYTDARKSDSLAKELHEQTTAFNTTMHPNEQISPPPNHGFSFGFGNKIGFAENAVLGFTLNGTYDRGYSRVKDGVQATYNLGDKDAKKLSASDNFSFNQSSIDILWGGLGMVTTEVNQDHKVTLTGLYNRNTTDESRYLYGYTDNNIPGWVHHTYAIDYNERDLLFGQFMGNHEFPRLGDIVFDWNTSISRTTQNQPDLRFLSYDAGINEAQGDSTWAIQQSLYSAPTRYYTDLNENGWTVSGDLKYPIEMWQGLEGEIMAGGNYVTKERDQDVRHFVFRQEEFDIDDFGGDVGLFFSEENWGNIYNDTTGSGNVKHRWGHYVVEFDESNSNYIGYQTTPAGYLRMSLPFTKKLRAIGGVRFEQTLMHMETKDTSDTTEGHIHENDWLPAITCIYEPTAKMNVRVAYGRTVARPTLREMAAFTTFDFLRGDQFTGNPFLKRTLVDNFDIRWEWFRRPGEILALSGFYKRFDKPIQRVRQGFNKNITAKNVPEGRIAGIEFEARTQLDWLTPQLKNLKIGGNLSLIYSQVDLDPDEIEKAQGLNPDIEIEKTRRFQGQSPYIVNLFGTYASEELGFDMNIFFNVFGRRLSEVSLGATPDVYEYPQKELNFSVAKSFRRNFKIKASAKNILNSPERNAHLYRNLIQDQKYLEKGRSFGLSLSYSLN